MVTFNRALLPLKESFFTSAKIPDQPDATAFCNCHLGADAAVGIASVKHQRNCLSPSKCSYFIFSVGGSRLMLQDSPSNVIKKCLQHCLTCKCYKLLRFIFILLLNQCFQLQGAAEQQDILFFFFFLSVGNGLRKSLS